jgi:hypothetical protein
MYIFLNLQRFIPCRTQMDVNEASNDMNRYNNADGVDLEDGSNRHENNAYDNMDSYLGGMDPGDDNVD